MLLNLDDVLGYEIRATDRPAGKVEDIYIDDVLWNVRHVAVADAGGVGIQMASVGPESLGDVDLTARKMHVGLTHDEVAGGPDVSVDLPVSRRTSKVSDPHLRSIRELKGYQVRANDGDVGNIDGFVCSSDDWKIHFIVVATDERKVLVGPGLIDQVDFDAKSAHVELDTARFAKSPEFDPSHPIERVEDIKLVGRESF